jgi:hypothetical protein
MNNMRLASLAMWAVIAGTLALLPARPASAQAGQFDGVWRIRHTSASCRDKSGGFRVTIAGGRVGGRVQAGTISGTISSAGAVRWSLPAADDAAPVIWEGRFRDNAGAGTYGRQDGKCRGTFAAARG